MVGKVKGKESVRFSSFHSPFFHFTLFTIHFATLGPFLTLQPPCDSIRSSLHCVPIEWNEERQVREGTRAFFTFNLTQRRANEWRTHTAHSRIRECCWWCCFLWLNSCFILPLQLSQREQHTTAYDWWFPGDVVVSVMKEAWKRKVKG